MLDVATTHNHRLIGTSPFLAAGALCYVIARRRPCNRELEDHRDYDEQANYIEAVISLLLDQSAQPIQASTST